MLNKTHDLLLKSFDSALTKKDHNQLDKALAESKTLRLEKEQFEFMRQTLWQANPPSFRPFFAERIMTKIASSKGQIELDSFFESLKTAFRPLAISSIIFILGLLSYNAIQNHQTFFSVLLPSNEPTLEQALDPTWAYFQE